MDMMILDYKFVTGEFKTIFYLERSPEAGKISDFLQQACSKMRCIILSLEFCFTSSVTTLPNIKVFMYKRNFPPD